MQRADIPATRSSLFRDWSLRHIARPRPAQVFVPQIDGLRLIAIGAVVLYHIKGYVVAKTGVADPGWLFRILEQGHFGVPLFFALSGYIIARQFFGPRRVELKRYFIRRLTRLEPPYLISMLLVFAAKVWALDVAFPELFPHLLASIVYLHNFLFAAHSEVNGVAWSLEIEWQFYVLAPLAFAAILRCSGRTRHAGLWFFILLGGYAHLIARDVGSRFELSLLNYFGFFSAGVWVALIETGEERKHISTYFDVLGIATGLAILFVLLSGGMTKIALPALTGIIVLCALRGPVLRRILGWWPIHCIGAMCYTIYLYHFFVVTAAGRLYGSIFGWNESGDVSLLLFTLVAMPLVLGTCLIPYLLIERPFMVWRPGKNRLADVFKPQTA